MSSLPISDSSSSFMTIKSPDFFSSIKTESGEMKEDEEEKEVIAIRELSQASYPKWVTVKEIFYKNCV